MNISRFVVLGALDILGNASGYDIIRFLDARMITRWTGVKRGSIYNALKTLEKDNEICEVERVKSGQYPTMTIYAVTDAGRDAFDAMQDKAFRGLYPSFTGFKLALKFNRRRSPEEIRRYADLAMEEIRNTLQGMDAYLSSMPEHSAQRRMDAFFIQHDRMLLIQETAWIRMVMDALNAGAHGPLAGCLPPDSM